MTESSSEYMIDALAPVLSLHLGTALDPEAETLGALIGWLVATVGTNPVVRALADAVEPGNLVAAMAAEGVLVQPVDGPRAAKLSLADGFHPMAYFGLASQPGTPLYQAAEAGEADRG